jgi:hypothetical protein
LLPNDRLIDPSTAPRFAVMTALRGLTSLSAIDAYYGNAPGKTICQAGARIRLLGSAAKVN